MVGVHVKRSVKWEGTIYLGSSSAQAPNSWVARWRCPQENVEVAPGAVHSGTSTISPVTGQLALGTMSKRGGFRRNRSVVPAQFGQSKV